MKKYGVLAVGLMAAALFACAPAVGTKVRVDSIEPVGFGSLMDAKLARARVKVGQFLDNRSEQAIGEIDGRSIAAEGDIGDSVRRAFESQLRKSGASVALFDAPSLSGEITEWHVKVYPGFPASEVEANATLRLRVLDVAGKVLSTALYSGSVSQTHPFLSESRIEETLGDAMAFAIKEALRDDKTLAQIARG